MQTIMIEFKIDKNTWQSLDAEKERHELGSLIDGILKKADLGKWSGSAERGNTIIIYCMVEDETAALETITAELAGHKLIKFLV